MRKVLVIVLTGFLAGCTSSVSDFFAVETVPDTPTGAAKTGTFPRIGDIPAGETKQLSDAQTESEKQELLQAVSRSKGQAAANNQANYQREVERLRQLGRDQEKRRAEALKAVSE